MTGLDRPTDRDTEAARLKALRDTALLDSPAEEAFDRLARLATRLLKAPVALVSLVDADRQYFKSCIGLPQPWAVLRQTPLSHSFCRHAVESGTPLLIDDARSHSLVSNNPAVMDLGVTAYAGIPLVTAEGYALGSFCVIDSKTRHWTEAEVSLLTDLAAMVMREIEYRLSSRHVEAHEEALRRSELRYRSLVAATSQIVWTTDAAGEVMEPSQTWTAFTGQPFEEFRGFGWIDVVHPEDRERARWAWTSAVERKALYEVEYRLKHKEGGYRHVVARGAPVLDETSKVLEWVGTCTDVTTEALARRAESYTRRALHESEQRLRIALETASLGAWDLDLTTGDMSCTSLCKANFGLTPEASLTYESLLAMIHPDDRSAMQEAVRRALAEHGTYEAEYRVIWPDGSVHRVLASGRGIYDEGGMAARMTGVSLDITARRDVEEQRTRLLDAERHARTEAEKHSRMKDEFLAILSHELRTPLNAILGWATVLRSGGATPEDLAEGLEAIERNARAQTQLIGDLLDMSRIISGKIRLDPQPIDLVSVVGAAVESVRPSAQARQIKLQPMLDRRGAVIWGDPGRLQQVLLNLLTNALKFTPAGGQVVVALRREGEKAKIHVIDSGEGISPEFLPHVFSRFRQGDSATSRRYGGLGLGLAIVRHLIELHGGSVSADSAGPGKGAEFTICLPLCEQCHGADAFPGRSLTSAAIPRLANLRVLVVDDEPDARQLVRRVLEGADAQVTTAASANEAFVALEASKFDLLICDLGMPEVDGYALIRKLRLDGPSQSIPAVALTAFARGEERNMALESGFQVHLPKSFDPTELLTTVAELTRPR